jgi:hypothetical protein
MKTAKILLWDEVDHEKGFNWPTPKPLPEEYITSAPTLASITELHILPLHRRKFLRVRKMHC